MFAIIQTGGKQYEVEEGKVLKIEKIAGNPGDIFSFPKILMVFDVLGENIFLGTPLLEKHIVEAEILRHGRSRKINVIKYKSKVRYRRKQGHRQDFTEVKITKIS